jgi:Kelch motif
MRKLTFAISSSAALWLCANACSSNDPATPASGGSKPIAVAEGGAVGLAGEGGELNVAGSSAGGMQAPGGPAGAAGGPAGAAGGAGEASIEQATCVPTGDLLAKRVRAQARLLSSGKVLVAGGLDTATGHVLASAELYDPHTGTFSSAGLMSSPRSSFTMIEAGNGQVLAMGGYDDQGVPQSSADIYDPTSGAWSSAGNMTVARSSHSAVALADGRLLIVGGYSKIGALTVSATTFLVNTAPLASAEIYDPESKTFSATGSMLVPRAGAGITRLLDGTVFVVAGLTSLSSPYYTGTSEIYSVEGAHANTFTADATEPGGAVGAGWAVTLNSGEVLTTAPLAALFDPATHAFHATASEQLGTGAGGILLGDGNVFLGGGMLGGAASAQTELYVEASSAWEPSANLTLPRQGAAFARLDDGRVLLAGGCLSQACGSGVLASAEICNPVPLHGKTVGAGGEGGASAGD